LLDISTESKLLASSAAKFTQFAHYVKTRACARDLSQTQSATAAEYGCEIKHISGPLKATLCTSFRRSAHPSVSFGFIYTTRSSNLMSFFVRSVSRSCLLVGILIFPDSTSLKMYLDIFISWSVMSIDRELLRCDYSLSSSQLSLTVHRPANIRYFNN